MSFTEQIGISSTVFIAAVAAVVGFAAFWSNPERAVNRGFFAASVFVAVWLVCLNQVLQGGQNAPFWAQATSLAGAAIFVPIWFIKESIVTDGRSSLKILASGGWLIAATVVLGAIRSFDWFYSGVNVSFWVFVFGMAGMYGLLCRQTIREMRFHVGLKRLELQFALLGGSAAALGIISLLVVRKVTDWPWVTRLYPVVILVFYTGTVVAITTSRVFNARQLLLVCAQKSSLVALVTTVAYFLNQLIGLVLLEPLALLLTVAVTLWIAAGLNSWLNRMFQFYPQETAARQAAFDVARRETRLESLDQAFLQVLKGWGQSDRALLLAGTQAEMRGGELQLSADDTLLKAMRHLRWVTPERLARERSNPDRANVARFLSEHRLGVLVIGEGPTLTALVGVGVAASRRPFTYPQVTQLMELAAIIESALERAHFATKMQHAEQLATVGLLGASLAHEIRNPLVSIKTFVQLLPTHHHDPAFRDKFFRLIGHEVDRIDRLTVQLLDLAAPRTYRAEKMELHPVLRASLDLVATKAAEKRIEFFSDFEAAPDVVFSDASAAKQVMLNLCFNAIQAVESREGERWVRVSTRNVPGGVEMAVLDSGPGISPEIRPRLFQPFQSTKSTGFGLGLAICSDILANLAATISVDPSAPGTGAVFRVVFPCQPSSS